MSVTTYHCLCTDLILATTIPLKNVPKRQTDNSLICTITDGNTFSPGTSILQAAISTDATPVVLKLEDGFEKRYVVHCNRCGLTLGYQLDLSQFEDTKTGIGKRDAVIYLLPGGVMSTEEMRKGKKMEGEIELGAGKAT